MKKNYNVFLLLLFLFSCSGIELVLKDSDEINPLRGKTQIVLNNYNTLLMEQLVYSFGNSNRPEYSLKIIYSENKSNKYVETNQVAKKIDYELLLKYALFNKIKSCTIIKREIYSHFSFVPKAFGYNFGSDKSLQKLFKNSFKYNIGEFLNNLPKELNDIACINEG